MNLTSPAFADNQAIPRRFTCDGEDVSVPLGWSGAPSGTHSFVVLCDDPDAPAGVWHHWAAYDIPPDRTELAEGAGAPTSALKQAVNDFGRPGWGGPCPPRGHGQHHYRFHLLALSVDHLSLPARPPCREVERQARKHVLAEATLVGLYRR
jgi:Raf kinase inhibitor-like YbhB/YbcL family protein